MALFRQYTGADGQARIETMPPDQTPDLRKGLAATQIVLHEYPIGFFHDWHTAPRRQFAIVIKGELEVGLGDGTKHIYCVGDTWLVEDVTGQGHTARVPGSEPCLLISVALA